MGYEAEQDDVVVIDIAKGTIKGYYKAKNFKRQIEQLKEELGA